MASSTSAIPLQPYSPATSHSPATTNAPQNIGNQQASNSSILPQRASSGFGTQSAGSSPTIPPPQAPPASSAQAAKFRERQWKAFKEWSSFFAKFSLAIAGLFATYLALWLSMWTSMKDYREDCRTQNSTLQYLTEQCCAVLAKPLSKPPLSSLFGDKTKRLIADWEVQTTPSSGSNIRSVLLCLGLVVATTISTMLGLTFCLTPGRENERRQLLGRGGTSQSQSQDTLIGRMKTTAVTFVVMSTLQGGMEEIVSQPIAAITEIVNSIRPGNRKTEAAQSHDECGEWVAADSTAYPADHVAESHTKADVNNIARTVANDLIEGDVDMVVRASARGPNPAGGRRGNRHNGRQRK